MTDRILISQALLLTMADEMKAIVERHGMPNYLVNDIDGWEGKLRNELANPEDFHDVLCDAKLRLFLDPTADGNGEGGEIEATLGATFGTDKDLTIMLHAGTNEAPIKLFLAPPARED